MEVSLLKGGNSCCALRKSNYLYISSVSDFDRVSQNIVSPLHQNVLKSISTGSLESTFKEQVLPQVFKNLHSGNNNAAILYH